MPWPHLAVVQAASVIERAAAALRLSVPVRSGVRRGYPRGGADHLCQIWHGRCGVRSGREPPQNAGFVVWLCELHATGKHDGIQQSAANRFGPTHNPAMIGVVSAIRNSSSISHWIASVGVSPGEMPPVTGKAHRDGETATVADRRASSTCPSGANTAAAQANDPIPSGLCPSTAKSACARRKL